MADPGALKRLIARISPPGGRDPAELRRCLMPPVTAFEASRQKRQHELG